MANTLSVNYAMPWQGPASNTNVQIYFDTLIAALNAGIYGPISSSYVTISADSDLTNERVLTGTSNQIVITDNGAGSTVVLSTPQNIHTAATPTFASETLTATTNQLVLGTTRTVTITAPTPATSSRTWTIPDIAGNGTFAALEGTQTFTGAKTFSAMISAEAGITIAAGQNLILSAGSAQIESVDGSNSAPSYSFVNETGAGWYRSASHDFRFRNNSVDALIVKDTGVQTKGQTGATDAAAGYIGEKISSDISTSTSLPNNGVRGDLTSITLTAGSWLMWGHVYFILNGATMTSAEAGISDTSGDNTTNTIFGIDRLDGPPPTGNYGTTIYIDAKPATISSSTTYYLKYEGAYSAGTPKARGHIIALRIA